MSLPPVHPAQGVVVLLGPARSRWPEPLATALELGDLHLEPVTSLYAAAAILAVDRPLIRALLLDPTLLSTADIPLLRIIKSRVDLPVLLLPVTNAASPAVRHATELGALSWQHAEILLAPPAPPAAAPTSPDNPTPAALTASISEIPVSSATEPRYDEEQPVLTDEELRALLGTAE